MDKMKEVCGEICESLEDILMCLYELKFTALFFEIHNANNVKIYNVHCPGFKTCGKSQYDDCFLCANHPKSTEYIEEKILPKMVEVWEEFK